MRELIVDNFAGGGGASTGIEMALGRPVDIAINHNAIALAIHQANHPGTLHLVEDVFDVDPVEVADGQPVGLVWLSPDCKHFSKAKGGKPRSKKIRGLAWVAVRWAATVRPRVIVLENVEEFVTWGPLLPDGQPCPRRKGKTFKAFVRRLEGEGYRVEWRELRACDYGSPTIRKRLFLIARCDGRPIVWPEPSHAAPDDLRVQAGRLLPWRTAAEIIDWSIPCPSIFERSRPLAEATLRRIARGIWKYVIETDEPFIVPVCFACHDLRTEVVAFLAKHYGGPNGVQTPGRTLRLPISTVTQADHHGLVASSLVKLRGTSTGQAVTEPLHTISSQGTHHAEVRAFLLKYYGTATGADLRRPAPTVTTRDRIGLVTVAGEDYAIVDIGMRMLTPAELFAAQGFPRGFVFDPVVDAQSITKTAQVAAVGNSVCPQVAQAIVAANCADLAVDRNAARAATGE